MRGRLCAEAPAAYEGLAEPTTTEVSESSPSTTSATTQVMLSGPPRVAGERDQLLGHLVEVVDLGEHLAEPPGVDHPGQPVGTEQVAVADLGVPQGEVELKVVAAVEDLQQDRPVRVAGGLLGGDPAVVHQRLDQGWS